MAHLTSHHTLPSFTTDIPTAPLVSVSLSGLESHDPKESTAFYKACIDLGFFYLDMAGSTSGERIVREAEEINMIQKEFFVLTSEEKDKYGRGVNR